LKTKKNLFLAAFLTTLLVSLAFPVLAQSTLAESTPTTVAQTTVEEQNGWQNITSNTITILFPKDGRKPMFLWWYTNEPDKIFVVKYQGLIEFLTFDVPFYMRKYMAFGEIISKRLNETFISPKEHMLSARIRGWIRDRLIALHTLYGLHSPTLNFQRCNWTLTGPENVTKGEKSYLSFNFTLTEAPPDFDFAEGNIIIRCRFYYTDATENVDNLYNYTVKAGELKMDFIINQWEWNIDKIKPLLTALEEYGITVPQGKAGLALWINLASIDLSKLANAENEPEQIEGISTTTDMIVEDRRVNVQPNKTLTPTEDERPIAVSKGLQEHFKLRFARQDRTLAGFFKFVASAKVTNSTGYSELWPVKAAYIEAGNHTRLFLCYPYFGNKTLEHDPSLGIEVILPLVSPELVVILVGAVSVIAVIVFAAKWKRKVVNVVGVR